MRSESIDTVGEAAAAPPPPLATAFATFKRWRRGRPFWAGVWTIAGGAIVAYVPATGFRLLFIGGSLLWLGILVGVVIAVFGVFFWVQPHERRLLGVLTILLGFASFVTSDFGGFFVGMLLTLLGGSLALAWAPVSDSTSRSR